MAPADGTNHSMSAADLVPSSSTLSDAGLEQIWSSSSNDSAWQQGSGDDFWFSSNCTVECGANCSSSSVLLNCTCGGCGLEGGSGEDPLTSLNEFHIIKAVVLVAVTSVLLVSVCRMVLQLFVRYTNVKQDK